MPSQLSYLNTWKNGHYVHALFLQPTLDVYAANMVRLIAENPQAFTDQAAEQGIELPLIPNTHLHTGSFLDTNTPAISVIAYSIGNQPNNFAVEQIEMEVIIRVGAKGSVKSQHQLTCGYIGAIRKILQAMPPAELVYGWPVNGGNFNPLDLIRGVKINSIESIPSDKKAEHDGGLRVKFNVTSQQI